jgi:anti-sigma factor RsiW
MMWRRHADDAALLELVVPNSNATTRETSTSAHIRACETCQARAARWRQMLDGLADAGPSSFDELVSPHHLDTQRRRVMGRIERLYAPPEAAHVLRFPAATRPALSKVRLVTRWMSAAAAAGLLVGVTIGQFVHLHPEWPTLGSARDASVESVEEEGRQETTVTVAPARTPTASLLDQLDLVLTTPQIPELTSLDEFTPRIREIAINPW